MQSYFVSVTAVGMVLAAAGSAIAAFDTNYALQIQARALSNASKYQMPTVADTSPSIGGTSPQINDARQVAFQVSTAASRVVFGEVETTPGLWFGQNGVGSVVYTAPFGPTLSTDVSMNQSGKVVFAMSSGVGTQGINVYDPMTNTRSQFTTGPSGSSSWTPRINDQGNIGSRPTVTGGKRLISYVPPSTTAITHASTTGLNPAYPYADYFGIGFGNNNRIVAFGRKNSTASSNPDQLVSFKSDGTFDVLVEDKDSNPASPYVLFQNPLGVSNNGRYVAFHARLTTVSPHTDQILLLDTNTNLITVIASTAVGQRFNSIDVFAPAVNDHGLVAFRATDRTNSNRATVFVADGTMVHALAAVAGSLTIEDSTTRVISGFGGAPDINNRGDIAFTVTLTSGGTAVYAAYIPAPGAAAGLAILGIFAARRRRQA